ncbi:class I SAM-dependent methyltransferase [Cognatiyoonia sp. IB215446]|uniref:class I SAM-dependent methyltransferase n=1 Tax=Cognatiyoonia sp. IB215446 TaxID=3097355 RepID=UPI002A13477A|nr:class I SAM-dependent methyltransferase [Cognatiyoonia sp. IB215446]MDX8349861.1 class I SAM-dependent methyltransferase [Cognatiyoonia sp. IB215446]
MSPFTLIVTYPNVWTSRAMEKSLMLKKTLGQAHEKLVFNRRVRVLVEQIGALLPANAQMLDVGTGDGQIAKMIGEMQEGTEVQGIDIMLRETTHIPVTLFDGTKIPMEDNSVDVVTFVDVLHHTDDPQILISEASRVARKAVIIKDHLSENKLDHLTLRVMDWVGNAPHGVVLPYNYAPRKDWDTWFATAGLETDHFVTDVPLYPAPAKWLFGRKLHFIARLTPTA